MSFFDRFTRPKISKLQTRGDVQGLIQALSYEKDYEIPAQAHRALVELGTDSVEPLLEVLKSRSKSESIRRQTVRILGEIGDSRAQWPVISILSQEDDWAFRQAAAEALGTVGDEFAVDSLLRALENRRCFTDQAIQQMKDSADPFMGDMASSALAVQEGGVQIAVVRTLEKIGDPKAADTLRSLQQALALYSKIKAEGPKSESLFADSVAKVERELIQAVDQALETLARSSSE